MEEKNLRDEDFQTQLAMIKNADYGEEMEIDLLELFAYLWSEARLIIVVALLCGLLSFVFTKFFITPTYQSKGSLYVVSSQDSLVNLSDFQMGNYLASDYERMVYTHEVIDQTIENLDLDYTTEELRKMVEIVNPNNTRILEFVVTGPEPQESADIANELMDVVRSYIEDIMLTEAPNILSIAQVPTKRFKPSYSKNIILGCLLGGLFVVFVLFIRFISDDKIKTPEDIEKYVGLHTLAIIPKYHPQPIKKSNKQQQYRPDPGSHQHTVRTLERGRRINRVQERDRHE